MSITRSQIARQLMAEGGAPRQGYFFGKLVKGVKKIGSKIKDDIIPNELKSPAGAAAAALAVDQFGIPLPGGSKFGGKKIVTGPLTDILLGKKRPTDPSSETPDYERSGGVLGGIKDIFNTPVGSKNEKENKSSTIGSTLLSGILSPQVVVPLASGLLAGAFTKDEEDPAFTGQDVGLNLRDIRRLANLSDPGTGSAIGLNFLPDIETRKFTPAQMASLYESVDPQIFTEQRESAEQGGIMGSQEDFNKFLEDMKKRDYGRMREQILRDYEEFMKRKRMINEMPEIKDGGRIMANNGGMMEQFKMASAPDPADKMYATMKALEDRVA
jgi:hypothetical protein